MNLVKKYLFKKNLKVIAVLPVINQLPPYQQSEKVNQTNWLSQAKVQQDSVCFFWSLAKYHSNHPCKNGNSRLNSRANR